ncbi:mitochondrial import inner membrane translocase subunit Tim54 [Lentinula detonsa]|uniref:Mitochondrial import inner membrane translocase subunit TIM54 n=1 Tax=Lentinula detonsa TaxID=2804962 RepID=A0A9W8P2N6_9AGAR|nr:mitochondrial import inner membrane translocase subunit Tim54 [Lentinula detonsa]
MSPSSSQKPKSGLVAALEYTGIPPSLLKRPKLPGRNWLIFFGVTGSLIGAYVYDRRQCRVLREDYIGRVRSLAEEYSWRDGVGPETLGKDDHLAWPRKLTVYATKWPGDEDYDIAMKHFRRYIKPIFVAAAIDYDMVPGKRHGDIALRIADEIKRKRAERDSPSASSESTGMAMPPQYHAPTTAERDALELAGGTVIVGRATLKEYFSGLVRGWTEPPTIDGRPNWGEESREEKVRSMLDDSIFDEHEPYQTMSSSSFSSASLSPSSSSSPLPAILSVPPILLVPFANHLGFAQIPYMLVDFFYRRKHVRDGGEAAWRAVCGSTREWQGPSSNSNNPTFNAPPPPQGGDLDFALHTESFYKSSKARKKYYNELPRRLWVAREFARRAKEAYDSDPSQFPPSEVQLRLERFEKEKRWMRDEEGWEIVRPERGVRWDERLRAIGLRVFVEPISK